MDNDVTALFISEKGPYPKLLDDCWDEGRDARRYAGTNRVVCHPPCARWSTLGWSNRNRGVTMGSDDGCFESALASVRRWGGVLEHPKNSRAFLRYDLPTPKRGRWVRSDERPNEWVTEVDQLCYGHRARKSTWLLVVSSVEPQPLDWRRLKPSAWISTDRPRAELAARGIGMLTKREMLVTPEPFARLLIDIARRCA